MEEAIKTEEVQNKKPVPRFIFCPSCHARNNVPKMLFGGNIKTEKGYVNIECWKCKKPNKVKI